MSNRMMERQAKRLGISVEEFEKQAYANYPEVLSILKTIKKRVSLFLDMSWEDQERYVLNAVIHICEYQKIPQEIIDTLKELQEKYKKHMPHDDTLLRLANRKCPRIGIPYEPFKRTKFIYKLVPLGYDDEFKKCMDLLPFRSDQLIIERLKYACDCWFINNVNMNGPNPYYERNWGYFESSLKITKELLLGDFESYMRLFEPDFGEEGK